MLKLLNKYSAQFSAFIVAFGAAMSFGADAFANDIDAVVNKTGGQLNHVGDLVNVAAYGGGAVLAGTGLLNFKKHVDNPSQNELRKAIGPAVVGIGLLAFPTVTGIIDKSMLVNGTNRGYDTNAFQATF